MATAHNPTVAVAANALEREVREYVKFIIRMAPEISIYYIMAFRQDSNKDVHIRIAGDSNPPGLSGLLDLLQHGPGIARLVFRALCTSHVQGILRLEDPQPGIRPLFQCGHIPTWNMHTRNVLVFATLEEENAEKAKSLLLGGDAYFITFTFASSENCVSLVIPRTIPFCERAQELKIAFAMGLLSKESLVWTLDVCLVDMILHMVPPVDESDVLAVLCNIDLNAL